MIKVFRLKVISDFKGRSITRVETLVIVAPNVDEAIKYVYNVYTRNGHCSIECIELLDSSECIVL